MRPGSVIAILGLSGSGKSYLARSIAKARPQFLHLSAGDLLRNLLHTTGEKLRTADGAAIRGNQLQLAEALAKARDGQMERPVLLEAHSFIDNDRELIDVPLEVMASLDLAGILLIDVPAAEIAARRESDTRKRPRRSVSELNRQSVRSRKLAKGYATRLRIPMISVASGEQARAIEFVDQIAGS